MTYFIPFKVTLKKSIGTWRKKIKNKLIEYPVLSMDYNVETVMETPPERKEDPMIDDDDDEVMVKEPIIKQDVTCFLLLANPKTGKMEWFDITTVKYSEGI